MRTRRLTYPAITLAATGALVLGGCTSSPEEPGGPVALTMTVWTANEAHLELFQSIADEYVDAHPDEVSSVTFETVPFDSYTSTVTTRIAGDDAPDLVWLLENTAPEFVESGALVRVDEVFAETEGWDVDDLNESALTLWSEDDALYAYPFSTSPQVVFANNDIFREAGVQTPRELYEAGEWTWENVRSSGATIAEATGKPGMRMKIATGEWPYLSVVWDSFGGAVWSDDYETCELNSAGTLEAVNFIRDGIYEDGAFPEPGSNFDFFSGQMALEINAISQANKLDDSFDWDVLPLPAGPAGQSNIIGQAGVGALTAGESPERAAEFLAYFTNPENAQKLSAFFPAPRLSLINADVLSAVNPVLSEDQLQMTVVDTVTDARTFPAHPNFAAINNALQGDFDALWAPDADAEAVLNNMCDTVAPLLTD